MALLGSMQTPAEAQLFERALILEKAELRGVPSGAISSGSLVIKGGRIQEVGAEVDPPLLSRRLDLAGKVITPGFIDVWSGLGRLGAAGRGEPTGGAWDAFDGHAIDAFRDAWRNGVTALAVVPGEEDGIGGGAAVVVLEPAEHGWIGKRLMEEEAVCINLASPKSPLDRLKVLEGVRGKFKAAVEYREALEIYEEELEEYLEKLEERKEKDGSDSSQPGKEEEKGSDEGHGSDDPDKKSEPPSSGIHRGAFDNEKEKPSGEKKEASKTDGEKDEEELKKPERPKPDRDSELLLECIDRKRPVWIHAHHSADIFNALELAEEFNLDAVLMGGAEAYLLADQLAGRDVPVVLGPPPPSMRFHPGEYRRARNDIAGRLEGAGVRWYVGSGGGAAGHARFIAQHAQNIARGSGDPQCWLDKITRDAARFLGVERQIGILGRGARADLVVWSGDPADPASRVEQVYVSGELVYEANEDPVRKQQP